MFFFFISTGYKPFKCLTCQKEFLTGYVLKKHMETHVSERRYKCGECGKQFKAIGHVREHMRAHSDERPYHCSFCDKSYKTKVRSLCKNNMQTQSLDFTLLSLNHCLSCSRMLCRSTTALMATKSLTCVRTAPVASGKRALWCGTSDITREKSPSSARNVAGALLSMGRWTVTCEPKVYKNISLKLLINY